MSIKNILVHVDQSKNNNMRMKIAMELALKHDAHLCGLYIIPKISIPSYSGAYIPTSVFTERENAERESAKILQKEFNTMTQKASCLSEWHCDNGYIDQQINLRARYADLVVIGQSEEQSRLSNEIAIEDHVLIGAARPVLFIPYIGIHESMGKRIMVAWNGTREAVRAVNDALPLLKQADIVEVVSVNPSSREGEFPTTDLCHYLARHDVKSIADQTLARDISVADTLLSRASDHGIDLIVMGAYGHSRMHEFIFGGVTEYMLKHMTVPVLMSH